MKQIRNIIAVLALAASFAAVQSESFNAAAQLRTGGIGGGLQSQRHEAPAISWTGKAHMTDDTHGIITITATMTDGWHIYGMDAPADGPQPTRFTFATGKTWQTEGKMTVSKAPVKSFDKSFDTELSFWEGKVTFTQKFKLIDQSATSIKCSVNYMGCNDMTCLPPATEELTIKLSK